MEIHRSQVEHVALIYGSWIVAFRYCVRKRRAIFAPRLPGEDVPDPAVWLPLLAEECYQQCRVLGDLDFEDNPYAIGGPREHYDPTTGKPRNNNRNNNNNQHYPHSKMNAVASGSGSNNNNTNSSNNHNQNHNNNNQNRQNTDNQNQNRQSSDRQARPPSGNSNYRGKNYDSNYKKSDKKGRDKDQ